MLEVIRDEHCEDLCAEQAPSLLTIVKYYQCGVCCRFTKNLNSESINVSTWRGEGELKNLELNEEDSQGESFLGFFGTFPTMPFPAPIAPPPHGVVWLLFLFFRIPIEFVCRFLPYCQLTYYH